MDENEQLVRRSRVTFGCNSRKECESCPRCGDQEAVDSNVHDGVPFAACGFTPLALLIGSVLYMWWALFMHPTLCNLHPFLRFHITQGSARDPAFRLSTDSALITASLGLMALSTGMDDAKTRRRVRWMVDLEAGPVSTLGVIPTSVGSWLVGTCYASKPSKTPDN
ncbi:hypothetical protein B0J18DRAFT_299611 [Chaetomium sp. MPI-SDFR-AT-0129]|nr:hypothetical protein B0J18DRAFT_299611 [Chaetomium sp. MPI-SDFR-AT-0129]